MNEKKIARELLKIAKNLIAEDVEIKAILKELGMSKSGNMGEKKYYSVLKTIPKVGFKEIKSGRPTPAISAILFERDDSDVVIVAVSCVGSLHAGDSYSVTVTKNREWANNQLR